MGYLTENHDFFKEFVENTFNNSITLINSYLQQTSDHFKGLADITSETSYANKDQHETETDLKKTTYYNIKSIYDKISGLNLSNLNTDKVNPQQYTNIDLGSLHDDFSNKTLFYNTKLNSDECIIEGKVNVTSEYDLYQIFQVVDRGNNNIGTKILGNLSYLYESLYSDFVSGDDKISQLTTGTFAGLFSGLAVQSGFLLQQIPTYLNLNSSISGIENKKDENIEEVVDHLFGVHTNTSLFGDTFLNKDGYKSGGLTGFPGYIFQLGSLSSTTNGSSNENTKVKDLTNSFCLDVDYNDNGEIIAKIKNAPEDISKSNVTCFTIDFGKQNQQMFNDIRLDTIEFSDTEESINTWVNIVNSSQNTTALKNLFPVLEKRSFTCTVSGLGNMTIQPLTYFYLRNVPLFSGTYWITNVTHKITPNNMVTTFKGVRQPIVSKSDTRKELLNLLSKRAQEILNTNEKLKQLQTEGIPETSGDIKIISGNLFPDVSQAYDDGTGSYYRYNGQEIIGSYIYSITGSNDSEGNKVLLSYLYNMSKSYCIKGLNSQTNSTILNHIINIVIGDMKSKAKDGDERYDNGSGSLSLSKLVKGNQNTGGGYSTTSVLSELIDKLGKNGLNKETFVLKKDTVVADLTGDNVKIGSDINLSSNNPISSNASLLDINLCTFYVESAKLYKGNDKIKSLNNVTLFDLFNSYDNSAKTTKTIKNITSPVSINKTSSNITKISEQKIFDEKLALLDSSKIITQPASTSDFGFDYLKEMDFDQLKAHVQKFFPNATLINNAPGTKYNIEFTLVVYDFAKFPEFSKTSPIKLTSANENKIAFDLDSEGNGYYKAYLENSSYLTTLKKKMDTAKKKLQESTQVVTANAQVKFLGSIDGVAFFTSSESGGSFGVIDLNEDNINSYSMEITTEPDIPSTPSNITPKTTKVKGDANKNQIVTNNTLRAQGFTKAIVAGIMGNIHKESTFNVGIKSPEEKLSNGKIVYNYGLIQWNSGSYDLSKVGSTVDDQLDFLISKTPPVKKFLNEAKSIQDSSYAAYLFAKYVEICAYCNKSFDVYLKGGSYTYANGKIVNILPYERSRYALDFFNRFNDPSDALYWG